MVLQNWIIDKISVQDNVQDIQERYLMKKKSAIDSRRKKFTWGKNPERYILERYAITIILFMIAVMLHNYILRKCKLHKSQEKIVHLMYMNDIKLFTKNEKEWKILIQDIWMDFNTEECAMLIMRSGKW